MHTENMFLNNYSDTSLNINNWQPHEDIYSDSVPLSVLISIYHLVVNKVVRCPCPGATCLCSLSLPVALTIIYGLEVAQFLFSGRDYLVGKIKHEDFNENTHTCDRKISATKKMQPALFVQRRNCRRFE